MIGYSILGTNDITRAKNFYDPLMTLMGALPGPWTSETRLFYALAPGMPMLAIAVPYDGRDATVGNGSMVALIVERRALVDAMFAKALELGGADDGPPGIRGRDPNVFYGEFPRFRWH